MNKLGWITGAFLVAITAQATLAETTEEVMVVEPAFKSDKTPLIDNKSGGKVTEVKIPYSPVPIFRQRLKNSLEQIDMGVTKGWITADVAAGLKDQCNEIAPLIDSIKDPKAEKPLVDQIESKLTAVNAAVYAASNKPAVKEEEKKAETPASASVKAEVKKPVAAKKPTTAPPKKSAKKP
jgi:hypothetical protein